MRLTSDEEISNLLSATKTIAIIGVSNKPHRDSYKVFRFLCDEGFTVIPVNPALASTNLDGHEVMASLADINLPIDLVDVFRNSNALPDIVNAAIHKDAKAIWTQLGVVHDGAINTALSHELDIVMDRCPAIDIPRLKSLNLPTGPRSHPV